MSEPAHRTWWHRWLFDEGPSKELAEVRATTNGVKHSARLVRISAEELARSAQDINKIAKMLRQSPGAQ